MEYQLAGEAVGFRYPAFPGRASSEGAAFLQQLRPGSPVNGSIHSAAAQQAVVGRIDDGLASETGDVSREDTTLFMLDKVTKRQAQSLDKNRVFAFVPMQTFSYLYPPGDLGCNTTDAAVQEGMQGWGRTVNIIRIVMLLIYRDMPLAGILEDHPFLMPVLDPFRHPARFGREYGRTSMCPAGH